MIRKELWFFLFVLLPLLPILILGGDAIFYTVDTLDSELLYKHLLKSNNYLFSFNQYKELIEPLNGINLYHIHSQFNLYNLPFLFFDTITSYIFNSFIIRLIGFLSMLQLLDFLNQKDWKINGLIASSFATIPVFSIYGLTILGLPSIFVAFVRAYKNKISFNDIILIIIYIFFSVPFTYPILGLILISIFLFNTFFKQKNTSVIFLSIIFGFAVLISEFPLILNIIIDESHRGLNNFKNIDKPSFLGVLYTVIYNLFISGETPIGFYITIPIVIHLLIFKDKKSIYVLTLISIILILIKALSPYISEFFQSSIIDFIIYYKVLFLIPFIFYLGLIFSLKNAKKHYLSYLLIFITIPFNIVRNYEFSANVFNEKTLKIIFSENDIISKIFNSQNLVNSQVYIHQYPITYNGYISKNLFSEINFENQIIEKKRRSISFGFDSAVLLYNGFLTVDGYFNSHDKIYNTEFNKIQNQFALLGKNRLSLKHETFDSIYPINNYTDIKSLKVDFDFNKLKSLNCDYIFSSFRIENYKDLGLSFIKKYNNNIYDIYLYSLN